MPLRDDLLNPIAGENPAGADLRYDPVYDKIKEARREEDDAPQGAWTRARKVADWPLVIKLTSDALATRSKDLQLAAWLAEAILRKEGYPSFRASLDVMRELLIRFWDTVYPLPEDGDLELRAAPLEWVASKLTMPLRMVPLNRAGHDLLRFNEAKVIGTEADVGKDKAKAARRAEAIQAGQPTVEDFEKSFSETPKLFYKQLVAGLDGVLVAIDALDALAKEKFGDLAPNFNQVRESIDEVGRIAKQLLARKLELEPDPVEPVPVVSETGEDGLPATGGGSGSLSPEPVDRQDAASRVIGAARFLRRTEPRNPASYLMLRALRWGELRAEGSTPDPKLLDAPTTQVRTALRSLMLDSAWDQLLEMSEGVMGTGVGRGWLDLQRYALTALQGLGEEYSNVASAIRAEVRSLLAAVPSLPTMTMMDDMPTANGATLEWLREAGLIGGEAEIGADGLAMPVAAPDGGDHRNGRSGLERALAEVRAGRADKGIEMLMRAMEREKTQRGRFLRQAQLAQVMMEAGLVGMARPVLEEMMSEVDKHKLEEWEAGPLVAQPMVLLYQLVEKSDKDKKILEHLYLRICKLDPVQAIGFARA